MVATRSRRRHGARPPGFTLVEIAAVLAILGVLGMVAVQHLAPSRASKLELAALEVASAVRFARDEARRTGRPSVFELSGKARVRVFELDLSLPASPAQGPALLHPLSKHAYDVDLNAQGFSAGVTASSNLPPGPPGMGPSLGFDARGEPRNASDMSPLALSLVDVALGDRTRRVSVEPLTGRVTEDWL